MKLLPRLLAVLAVGLLSTGCVLEAHPGYYGRHRYHRGGYYDHGHGHYRGHGGYRHRGPRHHHRGHGPYGYHAAPGASISVGLGHVCSVGCDHAWDDGEWLACEHRSGCGHALVGGRWVFELR